MTYPTNNLGDPKKSFEETFRLSTAVMGSAKIKQLIKFENENKDDQLDLFKDLDKMKETHD